MRRSSLDHPWVETALAVALLTLAAAVVFGLVDPPSRTTLRDGADLLPDAAQVPAAIGAVAALSTTFIPTPLLTLAVGFIYLERCPAR